MQAMQCKFNLVNLGPIIKLFLARLFLKAIQTRMTLMMRHHHHHHLRRMNIIDTSNMRKARIRRRLTMKRIHQAKKTGSRLLLNVQKKMRRRKITRKEVRVATAVVRTMKRSAKKTKCKRKK